MSFKLGENVGPYQVMEQLGQGGMASVYKAYHAALDRYVALKVLHQAFNEDSTFIGRFQREARVVAKLEHPNIVPVYDYAEHEGRPFLVMKFIEGDTLKARLNQGPLSSREIETVVESVGAALGYAHRQGVLHRDIKPSNVLISTDNVMYLADFGLARIAEAGESTLSADSIMGTPQYISPEQAMGMKDLDGKTDIYSFGVMLYEMVVGRVPFTADTPFSIIHDHIYTPLPLPRIVNPNVPEVVERVLLKALAKDRHDRYQTVEELVDAFKRAWVESGMPMQGTSIKMRPTEFRGEASTQVGAQASESGETGRSPAPKRTSKWVWVGSGIVVILCCMVGLAAVRNNSRLTSPPVMSAIQSTPTRMPVLANTKPPLPNPSNESPDVTAARQAVQNDPGNPDVHLQLALVLWDDGKKEASVEELAQAVNLADPGNEEFYMRAAHEFMAREAWVPAAGMYVRLAGSYPRGEIPEEVRSGMHETVYKAAAEKNMTLFVFFERIDNFDLPLGYVARGRYALYNGSLEDARIQLENAERVKPDMYEAFLLKAEIEIKAGSPQEAKNILLSLSSDLGVPEWIRIMAEDYLKSIQ